MTAHGPSNAPAFLRWVLLIGGVGVIAFWWLIHWVLPDAFDPLPIRLALGVTALGIGIASSVSPRIERLLPTVLLAFVWVGTWWVVWLAGRNDFANGYLLHAMLVGASSFAVFPSSRHLVGYATYAVALIALYAGDHVESAALLAACTLLTGTLSGFSLRHREVLMAELAESRHLLEQRVAARTLELVNETRDRRAAEQAAVAALQAKSRFLEGMSHELRTPLSTILGYTALVLEQLREGESATIADLECIDDAGRRLLGLVDQVLDMVRVDRRGGVDLQLVSLRAVLEDVGVGVATLMERQGNHLSLEVLPGAGSLHTDPELLRQILANLLSNAARFTTNGSVRVRCIPMVGAIDIEVEDTGCGIQPRRIPNLFERFGRRAADSQGGHAGLGLAICQECAVSLGGTIRVRSEVGVGSTFTLRLPDRHTSPAPAMDEGP